jgi:hypothetical protein
VPLLNSECKGERPKEAKELIAYIFLKKGFFHKNMLRFRKSEESFRLARKLCNSITVSLVASYNLAKLYLEHKYGLSHAGTSRGSSSIPVKS